MTRLVRDVSQKAGKRIEVVTEGEDVELDRNVVEAITDPLVHTIRNSCDHGVEGTAGSGVRRASRTWGRSACGAFHAAGPDRDRDRGRRAGPAAGEAAREGEVQGLIPADVADAR